MDDVMKRIIIDLETNPDYQNVFYNASTDELFTLSCFEELKLTGYELAYKHLDESPFHIFKIGGL